MSHLHFSASGSYSDVSWRPPDPCSNSPGSTKIRRSILPAYIDRAMVARASCLDTFWSGFFSPIPGAGRTRHPWSYYSQPAQNIRRLGHVRRPVPVSTQNPALAHLVGSVGSADLGGGGGPGARAGGGLWAQAREASGTASSTLEVPSAVCRLESTQDQLLYG